MNNIHFLKSSKPSLKKSHSLIQWKTSNIVLIFLCRRQGPMIFTFDIVMTGEPVWYWQRYLSFKSVCSLHFLGGGNRSWKKCLLPAFSRRVKQEPKKGRICSRKATICLVFPLLVPILNAIANKYLFTFGFTGRFGFLNYRLKKNVHGLRRGIAVYVC